MVTEAQQLAKYVRHHVPIIELRPPLLHASLCVLDAVYAAQQVYDVRVDDGKHGGVIGNYCSYQIRAGRTGLTRTRGDVLGAGQGEDKLTDLINLIEVVGPDFFAAKVVELKARALILLPKRRREMGEKPPFRSEICLYLAQKLLEIDVATNTLIGLRKWAETVDLEDRAFKRKGRYAVKGIGYVTWHYLCMLAGNADLVKPDVHIRAFVKGVLGYELPSRQIVRVLQETAEIRGIPSKQLDNSIWHYQRDKQKKK